MNQDLRQKMRRREREMSSCEDNLLDLKFLNVLPLHLEMWLFRVAAGPCDLRMDVTGLLMRAESF